MTRWRTDIDTLASWNQRLVRCGLPSWLLAPGPGEWSNSWSKFYREAITYARNRGLLINLVLPGAPDWAQQFNYGEYVRSCQWFWSGMADHFGDEVSVWQVYNEADSTHYRHFTSVEPTGTYLSEFSSLVGKAHAILASPGSLVTTNLSGWPMNDQREQHWKTLLDVLAPSMDLVSLDVYPADNLQQIDLLPQRIDRVRGRYGMPVFIAEVGLQTPPGGWTEGDQKRYLTTTIRRLRTSELWGICIYQLRDEVSPAHFGVQRADGSPKAGFTDVMRELH